MKNTIICLLFLVFATNCVEEQTDEYVDKSTISDNDFRDIIKKIWLTNAHIYNNKKFTLIPKDSINNIIYQILKDKGVNRNEFEKSIKYYSQKPVLFDSLLKDLRDSLKKVYMDIPTNEIEQQNNSKDSIKAILKENYKFIGIDPKSIKKGVRKRSKMKNDTLK